ncbi:MAG: histidine triad nucleotide-binding protein [Bdellovibrionales bacterium]
MATLFSKILRGEIPGKILYQDDFCAAIPDIAPQAPTHILIFPKKEIPSLAHSEKDDQLLLGHLLLAAQKIAREQNLEKNGYRVVINTGKDGGQTIDHLHVHLLGGKTLGHLA